MKTGTFIDFFPGGVFGALFAGCALIFLAAAGVQTHRLHNAQDDIALYKQAQAAYADAQTTNLTTIADLKQRIRAIIEMQRLDADEAAAAATRATDTILLVNQRNDELQGKLDALYRRNPQARKWADTAVDPGVLHLLPAGPDRENAGRGSAGAGAKSTRSAPHAN